jgi:hypothetical protein
MPPPPRRRWFVSTDELRGFVGHVGWRPRQPPGPCTAPCASTLRQMHKFTSLRRGQSYLEVRKVRPVTAITPGSFRPRSLRFSHACGPRIGHACRQARQHHRRRDPSPCRIVVADRPRADDLVFLFFAARWPYAVFLVMGPALFCGRPARWGRHPAAFRSRPFARQILTAR